MRLLDIARLPETAPISFQNDAPLLEPWAVQAALNRRGLGSLSKDDIASPGNAALAEEISA